MDSTDHFFSLQVQKEREAEGEEFADKESFVTSAYRKKMEEMAKEEEEEERRAQGWRFMSCSHCQELGQQASWFLIG